MATKFVFPTEAEAALEKLAQRCGHSREDTIRRALDNLETELGVVEAQGKIVHRAADGSEQFWHPLLGPAT